MLSSALTRRLRALLGGVVVVLLGTVSDNARTLEICLHRPMNTMVADHDSDVVADDGRDEPHRRIRKKQKLAPQTSEESSSAAFLAPLTARKSHIDLEMEYESFVRGAGTCSPEPQRVPRSQSVAQPRTASIAVRRTPPSSDKQIMRGRSSEGHRTPILRNPRDNDDHVDLSPDRHELEMFAGNYKKKSTRQLSLQRAPPLELHPQEIQWLQKEHGVGPQRLHQRESSEPLPGRQRSERQPLRASSLPAKMKVCNICGDPIQLGESTYMWYNEHAECGSTHRRLQVQLQKYPESSRFTTYLMVFN